MLLAERDRAEMAAVPQQGVIEEARRRRSRRRHRAILAAVALLAGLAAAFLAIGGGASPERRLHLPAESPPLPAAAMLRGAHKDVVVRLVPNLEGAQAGWCEQVVRRHGANIGCGPLPTTSTPLFSGTSTSWGAGERDDTTLVLTAPNVATVAFEGGWRVRTYAEPELPYGLRVALLRTPHRESRTRLITAVAAFDSGGRRIAERRVPGSGLRWRIWNPPAKPPGGACAFRLTGGYRATTEWGQLAAAIRPYPGKIVGRGFLSCIDTEYYIPGRGMKASALLDAADPGRSMPAPIPRLVPVPGLPGVYNTPRGDWFEPLTARREGRAWLVVAGGGRNSEAARIRLLDHLAVTVRR